MEPFEELRTAVRGTEIPHRFALQAQAVVVVVLGAATVDGEPVLFVLGVAPEQVAQWPQRIDLQIRQRVGRARRTLVLEAPRHCVHGLHQHRLFVPVRPDQLEQAGVGQFGVDKTDRQVGTIVAAFNDRDVRQLARHQRQVGQDAAWPLKVAFEGATQVVKTGQVAPAQVGVVVARAEGLVAALVNLQHAAVHHHEGFGRGFEHAVRVAVVEGQKAPVLEPVEELLLFFETGPTGAAAALAQTLVLAVSVPTEHQVHEAQVLVEGQGLGAIADGHPQRQVLCRFGLRTAQRDAELARNGLGRDHIDMAFVGQGDHGGRMAGRGTDGRQVQLVAGFETPGALCRRRILGKGVAPRHQRRSLRWHDLRAHLEIMTHLGLQMLADLG